ncbi:WXG100 family type VII secretion target [Micromonospora sp. NPDC052213]|uniref:WXG100 family type VII secretion target n=1 Tax=Micromonospora sp. NPDC052213 TaxID=3155812 RepID=UPI0034403DED
MPRGHGRARSDFSQYSHPELMRMLHAGDPKSVTEAAEGWGAAGTALHERAGDIERQLREFEQWWDGGAARQYKLMINDLTSGIRQVASTAFTVRDLAYSSAEALTTAQKSMPAPVAVPDLAPSVVAAATTPLVVPADTPASTVDTLRQHQAEAVAEVHAQQRAQAASNAAHQQAVQVMSTLATEYVTAEDAMPVTPSAASRPATGTPIEEPPPVTPAPPLAPQPGGDPPSVPAGTPVDPDKAPVDPDAVPPATQPRPLFGTMFTAGLAAAAAALGGRFATVPPGLGARPKDEKNGEKKETAPVATANDKATAGGARISAGGAGGGVGGGGGGVDMSPVASQSLAGQASGPTASGLAGAVGTAAGVAAAKGMAGGFMPAMPFAPMGAGDAAGGRRIPPWLVETEDVWGEQSVVTPAVIGEEPESDQPGTRSWR